MSTNTTPIQRFGSPSTTTSFTQAQTLSFSSATTGTVTFPDAFNVAPVVVGCPNGTLTTFQITSITTTGFAWTSGVTIAGLNYIAVGS